MTRSWKIGFVIAVSVAAALPSTAFAHEKWFVDQYAYPLQTNAILSWRTALGLCVALLTLGVAYMVERLIERARLPRDLSHRLAEAEERLVRLYDWVPLVLGLHVAVPLLVMGIQLEFIAPNLNLARDGLGAFLALAQIVVALSLIYGALTRYGALLLLLLLFVGVFVFGLENVIEHVVYIGVAVFFFILGRGPFSVDGLLGINHPRDPVLTPWAVPALRIGMGASILALGFTEKLWNVPMGLAFLQAYPLNFFPAIGMQFVTDEIFVIMAGVVEVTAGILLISGILQRFAILVLWLPFNLTLPLLGWQELVGHLPIYGIMVVLLIFGPEYGYTVRQGINALAGGRRVGEGLGARG
jgi:uncharacterized membrane protein YphA (DoxX/SURF4 family)